MNDQTDQQLLRDYADHKSESAFAEIVRRHVDLVYSAAVRMAGDSHTAQDITQGVFLLLAQNSRQLIDRASLAGWLHCTARNLAVKAVRTDIRRRAREQEAAVMNQSISAAADISWEHIAPHLDEALGELSEPDREAVLLRYFKNHDLRTVGATLGISDDAAQKRVSRAVERMREFFANRGVTVGAGGLVGGISASAVQAAPVGLVVTISTAVALTGTALPTTATVTAAKAIAMTTLQKTIVTATIAVLAGVGVYEVRQSSQLRDQVHTLQQQMEPLADHIRQLEREREEATNQLTSASAEIAHWKSGQDVAELLKLRGQVGALSANARANSSASVMASIINDPAQKELARMQIQQALHARYDSFVQALNISDETAGQIGNLIIQNELSKKDRLAALMRGEFDVESASQDRDNAKKELESQISAILGDPAYAQFKQFSRETEASVFVKALNEQMGQNSLNGEQSKRLQNILADQPGVTIDDIDLFRSKESLDAMYQEQFGRAQSLLQQAAGFLTPEQMAALGRIHTSYWNEVRTKMTLYQQLIQNAMSQNNR